MTPAGWALVWRPLPEGHGAPCVACLEAADVGAYIEASQHRGAGTELVALCGACVGAACVACVALASAPVPQGGR